MDPAIDLNQRMTETIAQVTRQYFDNQRAKPGATGRSPDGTVEVTLDGLGDVTDVRVRAEGVPEEVAARLARSFTAAWRAAARSVAQAGTEDNPLAQRPGVAEVVEEQINERYGPPPEETPTASDDWDPTSDFLRRPFEEEDEPDPRPQVRRKPGRPQETPPRPDDEDFSRGSFLRDGE